MKNKKSEMENDMNLFGLSLLIKIVVVNLFVLLSIHAADKILSVSILKNGNLKVEFNDIKPVVFEKDSMQVNFDKIIISKDSLSVGWVNNYPNCCTSYPIPLKLQIYSNKVLHTFKGNNLPIWDWTFSNDDSEVIFKQETVHGGTGIHYEMRKINSEKLINEFNPLIEADSGKLGNQVFPKWLKSFSRF